MEALACTEEETWVAFEDDEEALSFSDLPVLDRVGDDEDRCGGKSGESEGTEEFEFRACSGGLHPAADDADMCAADEVFLNGQLLPVRPSVCSESGLFVAGRGPSRCDSMDRYSSPTGSMGFESSRSLSGRSSTSISRSQSTRSSNSVLSAHDAPTRLSFSSNFYAHPSPKPNVCSRRRSTNSARKSTGSAGGTAWGLLRLGLVKTPYIDLDGLTHRRTRLGTNHATTVNNGEKVFNDDGIRPERQVAALGDGHCIRRSSNSTDASCRRRSSSHKGVKLEKNSSRPTLVSRLRCSCSAADVVETSRSRISVGGEAGSDERPCQTPPSSKLLTSRRQEGPCYSRTFQWLAELPVPKAPGPGA